MTSALHAQLADCESTLRRLADLTEQKYPALAADARGHLLTLSVLRHRLGVAFDGMADGPAQHRHRFVVTGGIAVPTSFDESIGDELAHLLDKIIHDLTLVRKRIVRMLPRVAVGSIVGIHRRAVFAGLSLIGPGSVDEPLSWARRMESALQCCRGVQTPEVTLRSVRTARVSGFVAGVSTPLVVWFVVRTLPQTWLALVTGMAAAYFGSSTSTTLLSYVRTFPVRHALIMDLALKHTLPWWQGFAAGWNVSRVGLEAGTSAKVPVLDIIPRLNRPASIADLNASLVEAGSRVTLFNDTIPVHSGLLREVPFGHKHIDLPFLVTMGNDVMASSLDGRRPEDEGCSIRVVVTGEPDAPRFLVIIPGTQTFTTVPVKNPYTMTQNLHLMAYGHASNFKAALDAVNAVRAHLDIPAHQVIPTMAYGHSQGGIIAAALARHEPFRRRHNLTHVFTTGAPIAGRTFPCETHFFAIEHIEDLIPKLDLTPNPAQRNVLTMLTRVVPYGETREVIEAHRWSAYRDTADRLVRTATQPGAHPALLQTLEAYSHYLGPVRSVIDVPQYRQVPASKPPALRHLVRQ